tara:strand:- start:1237 stop:1392 length:156 start_codon:yes stop_codon:yes gene_type:complete
MADITRSLTNLEDISEGLEEIRRAITTGNEIQERIAKALEEIMQTVLEVNK